MLVQRSRCKKGNPNACCPLILWQYNLVNTRKAITALCWCIYTNQVECKLVCFIFMFPICIHWPIQTRSIWRPQSCYIWMQLLCACRLTQSKLTAREQTLGWLLLSALSCPPGPAMCIVLRDKPRLLPWVKLSWPLQHSASVETPQSGTTQGPWRVSGSQTLRCLPQSYLHHAWASGSWAELPSAGGKSDSPQMESREDQDNLCWAFPMLPLCTKRALSVKGSQWALLLLVQPILLLSL